MDGRLLLLVAAALIGAIIYAGATDLELVAAETGPAEAPSRAPDTTDPRHENIRAALHAQGRDLQDPASFIVEHGGFEIVGGAVAATEHDRVVWLTDVFPWHKTPEPEIKPSKIRALPHLPGCDPAGPAPGSRLANVFAHQTLRTIPIWGYSEAELVAEAERLIAHTRAGTSPGPSAALADTFDFDALDAASPVDRFQFSIMDVAVTETHQPVHLVLQTGRGRILWNLSLAPGAQISGVTLLGGTMVALANLPKGVPVEIMTGESLEACDVRPARAWLRSDPIFAAVDAGLMTAEDAREESARHALDVEAWNLWFEDRFGLRDDETRIGYDMGSIAALVGPIPRPEARVGWHGIDRRPILMSAHHNTILYTKSGPSARLKLRVEKRAKKILGADLSTIAPQATN